MRTRPTCSMKRARSFGSRSFALASRSSRPRRSWKPTTGRRGFSPMVAVCTSWSTTAEKPRCAACADRSSTINAARSRPACASWLRASRLRASSSERLICMLHDLEPGRKQPLRFLIGLERRLQQSGEALPGLEAQPHQVLELGQIGAQGGDQRLDRRRRLARPCRRATHRSRR